ncbi:MAG: 4a-hydroxytetrahydrobiopterin dehydratase [Cyanobacteria bacterium M5B4]|nr:4a-hydroxytetrahydrobiopterin dehydratase [Cyanobacteria bacterium KgW148]PLS67659.1 MAG: 4a-hydroxytetrahydrobiopterin dehydratase [Cyanobacteria bacterium M5B4]
MKLVLLPIGVLFALGLRAGQVSSAPQKLSNTELKGWQLHNGKLAKTYQFQDFVAAFGFMTKVALIAENLQHHPESSNVYDVAGISNLDVELARRIDHVYE